MPYIIRKRSDIPDGLVQTLELFPNTSQRVFSYQKNPQTGYIRTITNETDTTVTAGVVDATIEGLTAFFLGSVSAGGGAQATATLTVDTFANLGGGETFTISDGVNTVTFEIVKTGADLPVTVGNVPVDISTDTSAADVSATCTSVITAQQALGNLDVTPVDGAGTVALTNDNQNIPVADQNNTDNASTLGGAGAITAFVGATASVPLSVAQASTDATDVLTLLAYDDGATDSSDLDLASVNGAITTGSLTFSQHADLMQVLAGRPFVLEADEDLGAADFEGGGEFSDDPAGIRDIYETGALRLSFSQGRLSTLADSEFSYEVPGTGDVSGAALTVYADDGTLFA